MVVRPSPFHGKVRAPDFSRRGGFHPTQRSYRGRVNCGNEKKMYDRVVDDCPFCDYAGPSEILADYRSSFVIRPIDPVTEGHVLVVPRRHASDFKESVSTFTAAAEGVVQWCRAAEVSEVNVITSRGWAATQTVLHLHLHVVPRRRGDRLALPWSSPDFGMLARALDGFDDHGDYEAVVSAAKMLVRCWHR